MAKEKEEIIPNEFEEAAPVVKAAKTLQYVGPKPAPLISNLPIDLGQPRLGMIQEKYTADVLPEKYIEYVRNSAPHTRDWWK